MVSDGGSSSARKTNTFFKELGQGLANQGHDMFKPVELNKKVETKSNLNSKNDLGIPDVHFDEIGSADVKT